MIAVLKDEYDEVTQVKTVTLEVDDLDTRSNYISIKQWEIYVYLSLVKIW